MDNHEFPCAAGDDAETLRADVAHLLAERDALLARCAAGEAALVEAHAKVLLYEGDGVYQDWTGLNASEQEPYRHHARAILATLPGAG